MTDLQTVTSDSRRAVGAFVAAARAVPASAWTRPAAPGKWSPGQVTEHVALAYELSYAVLRKTYAGYSLPRLLRPVARKVFLARVLRRGAFGAGNKAPEPLRPGPSPPAPETLTARLQSSAAGLEADLAVAARTGQTTVDHPFFGRLPLTDLLRLQVIHTQHHRRQLPGVAG
jgi:hypothetical protein